MAKKKKKEETIKFKSLFDHIKAITQEQRPDYWNKLKDGDKKTFSTFMINRFMSMNPAWIETIAELDPYTVGNQLKPELVYKLYSEIFPKSRTYLKYVKGKNEHKFSKELVELVMMHFECSKTEVIDYLLLMNEESIMEIVSKYGYSDKEIKRILK